MIHITKYMLSIGFFLFAIQMHASEANKANYLNDRSYSESQGIVAANKAEANSLEDNSSQTDLSSAQKVLSPQDYEHLQAIHFGPRPK